MPLGASINLPFPHQDHIALVVRHKSTRNRPPPGEGHADVILPSGAPAGFFVDRAIEEAGTWGLGVPGQVYGYAQFAAHRPWYVNLETATARAIPSGVLLVQVSAAESRRFQAAWQAMRARPGSFHIDGFNCSSHAALAFATAGLMGSEIPGLDTPDNLFHELLSRHPRRCRDVYGYLGFMPRESSMDEMQMLCDVGMDQLHAPPPPGPVPPRHRHHNTRPGL